MKFTHRYSATRNEIETIANMPADEALEVSRNLSLTHVAVFGFYPGTNLRSATSELGINVVAEPIETPQQYVLAPYCLEGLDVVRGIALWQAQADYYPRHKLSYTGE